MYKYNLTPKNSCFFSFVLLSFCQSHLIRKIARMILAISRPAGAEITSITARDTMPHPSSARFTSPRAEQSPRQNPFFQGQNSFPVSGTTHCLPLSICIMFDGCPYCNRNALVDVLCQQRRERCASDVFLQFSHWSEFYSVHW